LDPLTQRSHAENAVPLALEALGLPFPTRVVTSGSLNMRQSMLASGRFVTCLPHSLLPFARIKGNFQILPIELPPWPTATMVLRLGGRAPSAAAEAFLTTLRELALPLASS
jgi:DNA-binding transcriptional LysR family regulator